MYWKVSEVISSKYPSCLPVDLAKGLILTKGGSKNRIYLIDDGSFLQLCYKDSMPMFSTSFSPTGFNDSSLLPLMESSWDSFTRHSQKGRFAYSIAPIVYSISASTIITWFFTVFVLTNYAMRATILMKTSTLFASIFLLLTLIKSGHFLYGQNSLGYLHGAKLLDEINESTLLKIFEFIAIILLQFTQVQMVMRTFSRQEDKRLSFYVGISASVISQAIWAASKFNNFAIDDEASAILPAFIYLVRIAMGICYAVLISFTVVKRINDILANKKIWLLTFLMSILLYSPVSFFIADIANAWVYELSDFFSVVNYVTTVVVPWEWYNKLGLILRIKEKEGVLGRRFYEDELYELDRHEIFVEDEDEQDNSGNTRNTVALKNYDNASQKRFTVPFYYAKDMFLSLTDRVISVGFSIPRANSTPRRTSGDIELNTLSNRHDTARNINLERNEEATFGVERSLTTSVTPRHRRDIFMYSTKRVEVKLSDDEDDEHNNGQSN